MRQDPLAEMEQFHNIAHTIREELKEIALYAAYWMT